MKTVIQANTYWNAACTLDDVEIQGIRDLTAEDVQQAALRKEAWCMVGRAVLENGKLKLTAKPECLPEDHPLAKARSRSPSS